MHHWTIWPYGLKLALPSGVRSRSWLRMRCRRNTPRKSRRWIVKLREKKRTAGSWPKSNERAKRRLKKSASQLNRKLTCGVGDALALERVFRGNQFHPSYTSTEAAIAQLNRIDDRVREEIVGRSTNGCCCVRCRAHATGLRQ